MSRTPSNSAVDVVTGSTWEDYWDYYDPDGNPIDLDGYEARLQVRTEEGMYGTTTADTLLFEAATNDVTPKLFIEAISPSLIKNRVRIKAEVDDVAPFNPDNERRVRCGYGIELFIPAGADPEYVIPYARGPVIVHGDPVRG